MNVGERPRRGPVAAVMTGPLALFESALRSQLADEGYVARSVSDAVHAMARLSGWMKVLDLTAAELTPRTVEVFVAARRRRCGEAMARRGLGPVLRVLRACGVAPCEDLVDATAMEALLVDYRVWMRTERGLAAESVRCYVTQARAFLAELAARWPRRWPAWTPRRSRR
jgi:integrase/recombinase XerD